MKQDVLYDPYRRVRAVLNGINKQTSTDIDIQLEKVAVAYALQLEAVRRKAIRSGPFWLNLYCACVQTAIYQFPIKILTSPLDLSTPISYTKKQ